MRRALTKVFLRDKGRDALTDNLRVAIIVSSLEDFRRRHFYLSTVKCNTV